jgi:hypothetical protein
LLQVDGYQGYNQLPKSIELTGCWAHCRRKYTDILTSLPKGTDTKDSLAAKAVEMIGRLYGVESTLNEKYDNRFDEQALADIYQTRQVLRPKYSVIELPALPVQKQPNIMTTGNC